MAVVASKAQMGVIDELMPTDEDLLYEEELLRNPYSLKMWWRYIQARTDASAKRRYLLFERALKALPGSYKLWQAYLGERRRALRGTRPDHPSRSALSNTYERALVSMHKMPRIWLDYLQLLTEGGAITHTRRAFDRALAALPITQHDRVWTMYLAFVRAPEVPRDTALRVYRRYLQLEPGHVEEYIAFLEARAAWGEAARRLAQALDDPVFRSLQGKSKHQLWLELADMITRHPREVTGLSVDAILRGGIRRFSDEVGRLWCALADYHIRRSAFEVARDVYEEGVSSVTTVRDFGLVFDALTHFEESLLAAQLAAEGEGDGEEDEGQEPGDGSDFLLVDDGSDLDLRLARLEDLTRRRPELLSSVMLRQNPHNVAEWHKRVKLFEGDPTKQILTYTQAVRTVDVERALGKPHTLWTAFARFYERHGDVANARVIFEKATQARVKYVEDLAAVWCEWAEMELRHHNYRSALDLLRRATAEPQRARKLNAEEERALPPAERLYRSPALWALLADLEESLGTVEGAAAVYERMLDLRLATPQVILNYALLLQESKHWEDSFRAYERGIAAFRWPHVGDIWAAYLTAFVDRYGGAKLERARDLFEQALAGAPPDKALPLYLQYAKLEEGHGLARHAMEVYARGLAAVPKEQRLALLDVYVARATEFFGIAKVREVYEGAIEATPPEDLADADVRAVCLRYAQLERKLGEVDRARGILRHGAALADPRSARDYWDAWNEFEVRHGNEDTFREMLRIKRSVAASYSQAHIQTPAQVAALTGDAAAGVKRAREEEGPGGGALPPLDPLEALEAETAAAAQGAGTRLPGFVSAGVIQQAAPDAAGGLRGEANPEEIELGGDEEEEEEEEGRGAGEEAEVAVQQKAVPAAVFGSLAPAAEAAAGGEGGGGEAPAPLGALERFKRHKAG